MTIAIYKIVMLQYYKPVMLNRLSHHHMVTVVLPKVGSMRLQHASYTEQFLCLCRHTLILPTPIKSMSQLKSNLQNISQQKINLQLILEFNSEKFTYEKT